MTNLIFATNQQSVKQQIEKSALTKNAEKFSQVNIGRICISLLFLVLVLCSGMEHRLILCGAILHLAFSVTWFVMIQFDLFIEDNHIYSGYIPASLDITVSTLGIIVTGNIHSPLLITYVIITALTSVVIYKHISLYVAIMSTLLYITTGILTIYGYLPNINLFSSSDIKPTWFVLSFSSVILCIGIIIVRSIVQSFVRNNAELYSYAEEEKKNIEQLLAELKEKYGIIEDQNDTMRHDLQLARSIQHSIIPVPPGDIDGLEIASIYYPMHEVGGDFYDFIYFKEPGKIGVFISDVSGHGVSAALITSMLKALINTAGMERTTTDGLLAYLNTNLSGQTNDNFITAIYAIFDTRKKTLTFSRAGHPPLIWIRGDKIEFISGKGGLLAIRGDAAFEVREISLNPGDKVLLVTDGLLEASGIAGGTFEESGLRKAVYTHRSLHVKEFIAELFADLMKFHGSSLFEDDICVVGFDVK